MGCSSCGTKTKDGKPGGCKSNGGCSSGGCNRMNVHNWLSDVPVADIGKPYQIIEVSFNHGSRKDFYKNNTVHYFEKGDFITVEGSPGFDVGTVSLTGELVKLQMAKKGIKEDSEEIKKIMRISTADDVQKMDESKAKEKEMLIRSRAAIATLKLDMKLTEVELQADAKKATFYYIAEDRVDYRELIKLYASDFKVKVEMKQIGIRQEAAKVGGIGSCGRELCCSTWLTDFKGVSTVAARYQNLSINQTKLSGQCGRLKCCLNYELDTYMDALKGFPENVDKLELETGLAYLQKKDIFKNVMWYSLSGSNKQYPLTIERVNEIKELNKKGTKAQELGFIELETKASVAAGEDVYVDLAGEFSLKGLEKANKKNKNKNQNNNKNPNQNKPNPNAKTVNNNKPNPNQQTKTPPVINTKAAPVINTKAPPVIITKPAPVINTNQAPKLDNTPADEKPKQEIQNNQSNSKPQGKFKTNFGGKKPPKEKE